MVAIRLRRAGSKKRPFFRVVVTDSRAARDSSFVEILGHYNPRSTPAVVHVNKERVDFWLKKGAQPSDSVRTLIARHLTVPVTADAPTLLKKPSWAKSAKKAEPAKAETAAAPAVSREEAELQAFMDAPTVVLKRTEGQ